MDAEHLLSKATPEPTTGCFLWCGSVNGAGYGIVSHGEAGARRRRMTASRLMWMLARGPLASGEFVCHRCDTPLCINPNHLFVGTHGRNMADRNAKGRQAKGERHGSARLSEGDVLCIREALARGATQRGLARQYGVHRTTIYDVRVRGWKSVGGEN